MRHDEAASVIKELKQLATEHDEITELIWAKMLRVAAIEYRQEVLITRLAAIRHDVPADA